MEKGYYEDIIIDLGVEEKDIERKDSEGNLLYTEHIKAPKTEVKKVWHEYTKEELAQQELGDLELWFQWYDLQVKQFERCSRLDEDFDKDMYVIDCEARDKAKRIKELREELNNVIQ